MKAEEKKAKTPGRGHGHGRVLAFGHGHGRDLAFGYGRGRFYVS